MDSLHATFYLVLSFYLSQPPFRSAKTTRKNMTSIKPLFGSVFLKSDFIALLTIAANEGFISVDFALSMTESISSSPLKNRISLRGDLTSLSGLRDTESRLRDISTPASTGRYKGTNRELERALDRMENGNEL